MIVIAPHADFIEVLKGEADGINHIVAAGTERVRTVSLEQLANRRRLPFDRAVLELRHVGQRRRRWIVPQLGNDELAASDRCRAGTR